MRWDVNYEGKGPDFILEIHHHGARSKDLVLNVDRYARLGVREYFVFDRKKLELARMPFDIAAITTTTTTTTSRLW